MIWTAECRKSVGAVVAVKFDDRDSRSVRKGHAQGPHVQVKRVVLRPRFRVAYLRQHLFTNCEMQGVANCLSISKDFAGRGGGSSIADNKMQLGCVPVVHHPVVDGAQRITDDLLPLPAKLTMFVSSDKVFDKYGCRFAMLQER